MATHTFIHFEHDEAEPLARLTSIQFDLRSTIILCEHLEKLAAASEHGYPESEVNDAFSTAILVRYSRAFATGVRKGLGEDALRHLSAARRANNERLRAFRDKHIAHSVNTFEDTKVQVRYCEERVKEEGITGVSVAHYRVMGLSSQDIADAIDLCNTLLLYVDVEITTEKKRLLALVRSMPLADILERPFTSPLTPDSSKISERRPRP